MKHCDLLVPAKFTVPSDNCQWPTECWGIRLGEFAKGFRNGDYGITETQRISLRNIGFEFNHTVTDSKQHVLERERALISSAVTDSDTVIEKDGNAIEKDHSCKSMIENTDVRIVEEDSVEDEIESELISETETETETVNEKIVDVIIDINRVSGTLKVPCLAT